MNSLIRIVLSVALAATGTLACTEVTQTIQPSPVDVSVGNPDSGSEPEEPKPSPSGGTITLEPPNIEVKVGKNVHVMIIVRDGNGIEVPSENISVSIIDKTLVRLVEIDNRVITFGGLAEGQTSVIISASGLQASLDVTVVP